MPSKSDTDKLLEKELAQPGPASPSLCAALGINASDLNDIERSVGLEPFVKGQPSKSLQKEDKELLLDAINVYISNRPPQWWRNGGEGHRRREIDFLSESLIKALRSASCP